MAYQWNTAAVTAGVPVTFSIQNDSAGIDITAGWLGDSGRSPAELAELMGQIKQACEAAGLVVGEIHAHAATDAPLEEV
jgi:hypothetical protein